jgi:hypothetical protein
MEIKSQSSTNMSKLQEGISDTTISCDNVFEIGKKYDNLIITQNTIYNTFNTSAKSKTSSGYLANSTSADLLNSFNDPLLKNKRKRESSRSRSTNSKNFRSPGPENKNKLNQLNELFADYNNDLNFKNEVLNTIKSSIRKELINRICSNALVKIMDDEYMNSLFKEINIDGVVADVFHKEDGGKIKKDEKIKKMRMAKVVTACEHPERKHYAKVCYYYDYCIF